VKIAVESIRKASSAIGGTPSSYLRSRVLARGQGWRVSDVICSAGPGARPVEEQHSSACIAIVRSGSFQYQSSIGRELMAPGSLMLGNAGQYFECGHEHGVGDCCISFSYEPQFVEGLAAEAGLRLRSVRFNSLRLPPTRELSGVAARAFAGMLRSKQPTEDAHATEYWEEIALELAVRSLEYANTAASHATSLAAEARVTRIVRMINANAAAKHELATLAQDARLSRYHFLRLFQQLTGLTPHQYVLRSRLRHAAVQLLIRPQAILDIAFNSGFNDVSNFNHAFRAEFGVSPKVYRRRTQPGFKAA